VSLNCTTWPELKELILAGNPAIGDLLNLSRRTLVRRLERNYEKHQKRLQRALQDAIGLIHLSTDMWSSPARRGHLAICVRWMDDKYVLQKALLALPQVLYSHSGESQAVCILKILKSYGIITKIGFHTDDNATSNKTLLEAMSERLMNEYQVFV
jgi:hypothetical protein